VLHPRGGFTGTFVAFQTGTCSVNIPLSLLICILLLPVIGQAQATATDSLHFPASRLSDIAAERAGAPQNWPVVSHLAQYNSRTNRFSIGPTQQRELNRFLQSWQQLERSQIQFSQLITEGGRVFAPEELVVLDSLFTTNRRLINEPNIQGSIEAMANITTKVNEVSQLIEQRRKADIEARLEQKTGQVDRRRGLITEWISASVGDLFQRADGIRTGRESQAQLVFLDGSDVVLYENTVAVIRQSRIDRLTNRSEVEIELSDGGVLTRLSAAARNQSEYTVNTGESVSTVRSNSFWAESQAGNRVLLSNFDGEVLVSAARSEVVLQENQGTVVVRGREPTAPIPLLAAPAVDWSRPDSVIYTDNLDLLWAEVENAAFYEIDIAPTRTFDAGVRTRRANTNRIQLSDISGGVSFVQIRAFDQNGLRGNNSGVLRLIRIATSAAPPIIPDVRGLSVIYSQDRDYYLTGTTQPGVRLWADQQAVPVDADGRFSARIQLDPDQPQRSVTLVASDPAGNRRELVQTIRYVNPASLFDLQWSVPERENGLLRAPVVLVSGQAYNFMSVELRVGSQSLVQPAGASGVWSRQFRPGEAREITVIFTDRSTGTEIARKTWQFLND
jgi:hypothetical protein